MFQFLIISLLTQDCTSFSQASLSLSSSEILTLSTYTFSLQLSSPASQSSSLKLSFPPSFSSTSLSSTSCKSIYTASSQLKCSNSALDLTISQIFNSNLPISTIIVFQVSSVLNPAYAGQTASFIVLLIDGTGKIIDSINTGMVATIVPRALPYFTVAPWNTTSGSMSGWSLETELLLSVPVNGMISMKIPVWNANYYPKSSQEKVFFKQSPLCAVEVGGGNSSMSCLVDNGYLNMTMPIEVVGKVRIYVAGALSPPSLQPVDNLNVTVFTKDGVSQYFANASVSSLAPCLIYPVLSMTNETVSATSDYILSFYTCNPVSSKTKITIEVPSEITAMINSIAGIFGLDVPYPNFNLNSNIISITNPFNIYKEAQLYISIRISSLINPKSTSPTSSFKVSLLNNGFLSDFCGSDLHVTAAAGTLIKCLIAPLNPEVSQTTSYTFTLKSENPIPASSTIKIKLPLECSIQDTNSTPLQIVKGISPGTFSAISNTIYITGCFLNIVSQEFSFSIPEIRNPRSSKPSSLFSLWICTDATYSNVLYQSLSTTVTAVPSVLLSGSINPKSFVTGDITEYNFEASRLLMIGDRFTVVMPGDIVLTVVNSPCIWLLGFVSNERCVISEKQASIEALSEVNNKFGFTIANIKNPVSTKPANFTLQILDYYGFIISSSYISISMAKLHEFSAVLVQPSSLQVSSLCSYDIKITPFNTLPSTAVLLINSDLPLNFAYCLPPVTCRFSTFLTVYLNNVQPSISLTLFNITNPISLSPFLINITSQSTYSYDFSSISVQLSIPGLVSNPTLTATSQIISNPSTLTLTFTPQHEFSLIDSLTISFPQGFSQISYETVSRPNTFTIQPVKVPITLNLKLPAVPFLYNISLWTGLKGFIVDSGVISMRIICSYPCANCSNLSTNCTSCEIPNPYLQLHTCASSCPSGQADIGNFTCSSCSKNCQVCTSIISCTQCSPGYYLNSSVCVDACPQGRFATSSTCQDCSLNCNSCIGSSTNCTSCIQGKFLHKNSCVSECLGLVVNGLCLDCQGCKTCSGSLSNCIGCDPGMILYQNSCYSVCPEGTLQIGGGCVRCINNCKTCSGKINHCESCTAGNELKNGICIGVCGSGYFYSQGVCLQCAAQCKECLESSNYCVGCEKGFAYNGTCLDECPGKFTVVNGGVCVDCISNCQTCSISVDNCTGCITDMYLFNSSCLFECPKGWFSSDGLCVQCNQYCELCNESVCLICEDEFYVYNGKCVKNCPLNTYSLLSECLDCDKSCKTCHNASTQCSSCATGKYLYNNSCGADCPVGFTQELNECVEVVCGINCTAAMLNNSECDNECDIEECDYDNSTCVHYNSQLLIRDEPMSFTTAAAGVGFISGAAAALSAGSFMSASISFTSGLESGGWYSLLITLSSSKDLKKRSMLETQNKTILTLFTLILLLLIFRQILNVIFSIKYLSLSKIDSAHTNWRRKHRIYCIILNILMVVVSFKCIKLCFSGIFHLGIFSARFDRKREVLRLILIGCAVDLILISVPMVCACSYMLASYSKGSFEFILALDVWIVTVVSMFMMIIYVVQLYKQVNEEQKITEMVSVAVPTAFEDLENSSEESSRTGYEDRYAIIKRYLDNLKGFESRTNPRTIQKTQSLDLKQEKFTSNKTVLSFEEEINESYQASEVSHHDIISNLNPECESSVLSLSSIEIEFKEIHQQFEFVEVDKDDFEVIRVKCKDLPSVLVLQKSFEDGVVVDEEFNEIIPQPKFSYKDLVIVKVLKDSPCIGIFRNQTTGEIIRIMRCFDNARVIRDRRGTGNYEFMINSRKELIDGGVKQGHPLYWKFEDPRIQNSFQ